MFEGACLVIMPAANRLGVAGMDHQLTASNFILVPRQGLRRWTRNHLSLVVIGTAVARAFKLVKALLPRYAAAQVCANR